MNAAEEQTQRLVPRMQTWVGKKLKWQEAWPSATSYPINDRTEKVEIVEKHEMATGAQRAFRRHGNVDNQCKADT